MNQRPPLLFLTVYMMGVTLIESCHPNCGNLPNGSRLIHVSMVYRHGDRNPISEYPTSEFYSESNWKEGFGQLTLTGMKQHFEFGKWIMATYGPKGLGLLPPVYNLRDYKVLSTDLDRTIMSSMANSAGIYSPPESSSLTEGLRWNPVPTRNIEANEYDEIFGQFCPKMNEILLNLREERFKELQRQDPKLFEYADKYSGYGIVQQPLRMYWLYDTALVEKTQKGRIPKWMEPIFPQPLQSFFLEFLKEYVWTQQLKRFNAGPILKTIIETMMNKTLGLDTVKLSAYSAHDNNVFNILSSLGMEPKEPPRYTSAVIFELYRSPTDRYYVRMMYRPGPGTVPHDLIMPGCGGTEFCRLESFVEATKRLIPTDLKEECKADSPEISELAMDKAAFMEKLVDPFLR